MITGESGRHGPAALGKTPAVSASVGTDREGIKSRSALPRNRREAHRRWCLSADLQPEYVWSFAAQKFGGRLGIRGRIRRGQKRATQAETVSGALRTTVHDNRCARRYPGDGDEEGAQLIDDLSAIAIEMLATMRHDTALPRGAAVMSAVFADLGVVSGWIAVVTRENPSAMHSEAHRSDCEVAP